MLRQRERRAHDVTRFPAPRDLPITTRAGVAAWAAADIGLRTAAATMVAGAALPNSIRMQRLGADLERLDFYRALANRRDLEVAFPRPSTGVEVEDLGRPHRPQAWWGRGAVLKRFRSDFVPLHPEIRTSYLDRPRNSTAWALHRRHADGPRPTIVVVHGFMASPYWVNDQFFNLPWFHRHGYDQLLVTLPFHGRRREAHWHYNGQGLFTHGLSQFIEAVGQGIHDLRVWIDHLEASGVERIGVTGISLGGYMSSLLASVDERVHFAIPNVPVSDFAGVVGEWSPMSELVTAGLRYHGATLDDFAAALRVHSPLYWDPLIPHDRRLIIAGLGDRLAPPDQARRLWEHWDQPEVHWFPGNHILHVDQGAYLKRMGRFLQRTGFALDGAHDDEAATVD